MYISETHKKTSSGVIAFFAILVVLFSPLLSVAQTNVHLNVQQCNNNNTCEANLGENTYSCPNDCMAVPTSTPTTGGGIISSGTSRIFISNLEVRPDVRSVIISWFTNRITSGTLAWGTTLDYESGSVSEINYTNNHSVKIENLTPGTRYFFKIDVQDNVGAVIGAHGLSFETLDAPDTDAPANVTKLQVIPTKDSLQLQWKNPTDIDFDGVRITKSTQFYPRDPFEGKIVYEGKGNYVTDVDVKPGVTYYYAVFSKDDHGNYSSGALAVGQVLIVTPTGQVITPTSTNPFENPIPSKNIDPKIQKISLIDFDFSQQSQKVSFSAGSVKIHNEATKISIAYDKFPENLKTIGVTVKDPYDNNSQFTFLLKINKNKTAYEATIGKFERGGVYSFEVVILDYNRQALKKIDGTFVVPQETVVAKSVAPTSKRKESQYDYVIPLLILILIFVAIVLLLNLIYRKIRLMVARRRAQREES